MNTKRHSAGPTLIPDAERWGSVHWSASGNSLEFRSASTTKFTVIEQNEREIAAALKRSEALRQSILKKAFTGQLVPQDPADESAAILLQRIRSERETQSSTKPAKKAGRKRAKIQ